MEKFTNPGVLDNKFKPIKVGGGVKFAENKEAISDEELSNLYSRSKFLLFPSLDEGFGLPVLEALLHRCIVISNDIPTSREIDMGEDVIEFIDVRNFDFSKVNKFLLDIQDKKRDYEKWYNKYSERSKAEVEEFRDFLEKKGWL